MYTGIPVMAESEIATRTSWPPPSRVEPSREIGLTDGMIVFST